MTEQPPIINQPELQSSRMRIAYATLTALLWALWLYLWIPLLTMIAWGMGLRVFFIEMLLPENLDYLRELLSYLQILVGILLVILAWSHYNLRRYGDLQRRKGAQPLTPGSEAAHYDLDLESVLSLKRARLATVTYDASNRLQHVDPHTPEPKVDEPAQARLGRH